MIWILVIIIVAIIYNAERLPDLMNKFKKEVPHIVETGKKLSKDLKEKAQAAAEKRNDNTKSDKKSK
jgi:Sec-independent protein translocase protein TatA